MSQTRPCSSQPPPAGEGAPEVGEESLFEPAAPAESEPVEPESEPVEPDAEPTEPTEPAEPVARRRIGLPRGMAVAGVVLVGALAVSAFATVAPSSADADRAFVDTVRSQGHRVAPGDQQSLIVSAARKLCDRRDTHATAAQRRATTLSTKELHAVQQTFTADTRGFTALALDTYCPD